MMQRLTPRQPTCFCIVHDGETPIGHVTGTGSIGNGYCVAETLENAHLGTFASQRAARTAIEAAYLKSLNAREAAERNWRRAVARAALERREKRKGGLEGPPRWRTDTIE
jgi:hypothetical protein